MYIYFIYLFFIIIIIIFIFLFLLFQVSLSSQATLCALCFFLTLCIQIVLLHNSSNNNNVSYFYSANWHMNMMKCALKFWRKSNQHCPNHYFAIIVHKSNQIKSKLMSNFGFWWEGKTGVRVEKPLMAEERTNKLYPHMTLSVKIEPGPHWWKASALTTRSTLPQ